MNAPTYLSQPSRTQLRGCLWFCAVALCVGSAGCKTDGAGKPGLQGTAADGNGPRLLARTADGELAHLEKLVGSVFVKPHGQAEEGPGAELMRLDADDSVSTGADSEVDIVYAGNNRVHLGANSALLLHESGGLQSQVGAIVLKGRARVSSGGSGLGINIGTPIGMAQLGPNKISVLEIDLGSGLHLTTGEVVLARADRIDVMPLTLGQTMRIDALPVLLPSQQMLDIPGLQVQNLAPPAPPAIPARITRRQGGPERLVAGREGWQAVEQGELLRPGDRLRLHEDDSAELALADGMALNMRGAGEVTLGKTEDTPEGRRARYSLDHGRAELRITTREGRPAQQALVAGLPLGVAPGAREAKVDIDQADGRNARVVVRFGKVRVGEQELEAGQAVDVIDGALGATYPAFAGAIELTPGRSATVFVANHMPAFRFGSGEQGTHHVELASDADFGRLTAAEDTTQAALSNDEVGLGATYWRTGADGSPAAKLDVRREQRGKCGRCIRSETVDDTGESSVISYQNELPQTTLRWSEVQEAKGYQLQVVAEANPNAPVFAQRVDGTQLLLPPGLLEDASYVWTVTPVDAAGEALVAGKENHLRFDFDNMVKGLHVRVPRDEGHVRHALVQTKGEMELGASLQINGVPVSANERGEFVASVPLNPGLNRLVYTLRAPGKDDRIYVRTVVRDVDVAGASGPVKKRSLPTRRMAKP